MKLQLLIIPLLFFCIQCSAQQVKQDTSAVESQVRAIREEFNKINSDSAKLRVVKKDIMDESTEGGEIDKFYEGKTMRKAILLCYGETGKSSAEYYFLNNQLIFLYTRYTTYTKPFYIKGYKIARIDENRYYFYNGKLIRWLGSKGKLIDKSRYAAKGKEILGALKEDMH
jgi:hypothetical protein